MKSEVFRGASQRRAQCPGVWYVFVEFCLATWEAKQLGERRCDR